jgi:peptidyl-prolyl cis-trans isomerase B (cyclophilin B)
MTYVRRFPTIAPGDYAITARYQSGAGEVVATAVKAKVEGSTAGNKLVVTVATHQHGSFSFELKPQDAPASVTSFVELVKKDFYRDMIFFRVIPKNWIQTGCPYSTGLGGPGYAMKSEAETQTSVHDAGTVSLAGNEKGGWTGSQFFITLSRLPGLDKKFTIIGKLVDGQLDVVNAIGKADVDKNTDRPRNDIRIQSVTVAVK